jgi:hypothetical protein
MDLIKGNIIRDLMNQHTDALDTLLSLQGSVEVLQKKLEDVIIKRDEQLAFTQEIEKKISEIDG